MLKGLKGILEKGLQIAAPFIGNAILPGGLGATFGSGIASLLTGNKPKDALMSAGATYLSGFGNPQGSPLSKLFGNKSPEEFKVITGTGTTGRGGTREMQNQMNKMDTRKMGNSFIDFITKPGGKNGDGPSIGGQLLATEFTCILILFSSKGRC